MIDTNVLISAALSIGGIPFQAYTKAASYPNHGLICEQNVDEMKRIFNKKFPNRLAALDKFLLVALLTLEIVSVPADETVKSDDYDTSRIHKILTSVLADKNSAISGEITGSVEFCREKWILIRNSDISEKAAYLFAFLLSSYIILGYVEK